MNFDKIILIVFEIDKRFAKNFRNFLILKIFNKCALIINILVLLIFLLIIYKRIFLIIGSMINFSSVE